MIFLTSLNRYPGIFSKCTFDVFPFQCRYVYNAIRCTSLFSKRALVCLFLQVKIHITSDSSQNFKLRLYYVKYFLIQLSRYLIKTSVELFLRFVFLLVNIPGSCLLSVSNIITLTPPRTMKVKNGQIDFATIQPNIYESETIIFNEI